MNSVAVVASTSGLATAEGFHNFFFTQNRTETYVEPDRYEMAHGDTWDGKLRGNKRMEWGSSKQPAETHNSATRILLPPPTIYMDSSVLHKDEN